MIKSIKELNEKIWYRTLKVVYLISFIGVLAGYNIFLFAELGIKQVSQDRTVIECNYGSGTFSATDAEIYLDNGDFIEGKFSYKLFFLNYNDYNIRKIISKCIGKEIHPSSDVFVLQKAIEIRNDRNAIGDQSFEFSEDDGNKFLEIDKKYSDLDKSPLLDWDYEIFKINPAFSYWNVLWILLANIVVVLLFELARRIFYYIVLGKLFPTKNK
ncbi:MAG: hypothetical protein MRY49_00540 [Candidatus Pacebacteria bacterium]|nr:hypothetical protein [Candidatus Paceibacterota bacterium]